MERPANIDLPFFAYGLFRPGQLAFFQLRELVSKVTDPAQISGSLLLRDGLPIIGPNVNRWVKGVLLTFSNGRAVEAYDRISAMEPDNHYRCTKAKSTNNWPKTCCWGVLQGRAAFPARRMIGTDGTTRSSRQPWMWSRRPSIHKTSTGI